MKAKPKKKKIKLGVAKKKAWEALSKVVRYANSDGEYASCVTCGITKPWKELQTGHFIPKAQGNAIYFALENCNPQCYRCNINLGGNGAEYYPYMLRAYGEEIIKRLKVAQQMTVNYRVNDYLAIAEHYTNEFNRISDLRSQGRTGVIQIVSY